MLNSPHLPKVDDIRAHSMVGVTFGRSAASYASGRKAYPDEVFELLSALLSKKAAFLELGCGTGLATKQLYERGFESVIATDIDSLMLDQARTFCPQISFQAMDANDIPFQKHIFDAVVAFGCFHWFCNPQAILEIERVLKHHGILFIVNKNDAGPFRDNFRRFLEICEGRSISESKAYYRPRDILTNLGFKVEIHPFKANELFTQEQLFAYCQSISLWTSLPAKKQQSYTHSLEKFVSDSMHGDCYERSIEVHCLIAFPK